jgi:hypothetical protein
VEAVSEQVPGLDVRKMRLGPGGAGTFLPKQTNLATRSRMRSATVCWRRAAQLCRVDPIWRLARGRTRTGLFG